MTGTCSGEVGVGSGRSRALGPRGWVQITNLIVFGVLFLLFTRAVAAEFTSGKASRGGLILLTQGSAVAPFIYTLF